MAAKKTAKKKAKKAKKATAKKKAKKATAKKKAKPTGAAAALADELRAHALGLPEAWQDNPWDDWVAKVRKKIFAFVSSGESDELRFSVKLPVSHEMALELPFTTPTGYGLGKAGWVSGKVTSDNLPPAEMLTAWIDESYRAVAPKKLAGLVEEKDPFGGLRRK
jgi:predicted DNA-binding protein (MmcQ/YjbR family)